MKSNMWYIAIVIVLIAIAGLLWHEEERIDQGNWREGTSFANLEVGDNLTFADGVSTDGVSLTFLGETQVSCDDFPPQAQEECKESKFFAFKIKDSKAPLKVYQGHLGAYIALEGTKKYYENMTSMTKTVIFSSHGLGGLFINFPKGSYDVKYDRNSFGNLTSFKIEKLFLFQN